MQRKSRTITSVLVAWLVSCALLGCSGKSTTQVVTDEVEPSYSGVTLTVACPDEPSQQLIQEYGQGWARRNGAKLTTVRYRPLEAIELLPDADVWLLAPADLPSVATKLAPVPAAILAEEGALRWKDILPIYRTHLLKWDGQTYAVPLLGDAVVCFYRRDLFDDPKHQAEFQKKFNRPLQAPATWEDVLEIAEYFHAAWARPNGTFALAPFPVYWDEPDYYFYSVAAPYARRGIRSEETVGKDRHHDKFSFHYDNATGECRLKQPGFVYALDQLQKMQAFRDRTLALNPEEAFAKGQGVIYIGPPQHLRLFQDSRSQIRDGVGICAVPGSRVYFPYDGAQPVPAEQGVNVVPYRGARGLLGTVPSRSKHIDAAWSFLADLSRPEQSRQIVGDSRWGGCPYRLTHLDDRWDGLKPSPKQAEQLRKTLIDTMQRGPQNPVVQLRTPDARIEKSAVLDIVMRAVFEQTDPERQMRDANTTCTKRHENRLKEHRDNYLLSLGLDRSRN